MYTITSPLGVRFELTKQQLDVMFHILNNSFGASMDAAIERAAEYGIKREEFFDALHQNIGVLINVI